MKVAIIGGGPAGMLSAISAKKHNKNAEVIIFEKMNSCGRKLLITGKGRCNITNNADMSEFFQNILRNEKFLYSAFKNFTNQDIVKMLETYGVKTKVERGNRIFPKSDSARDVLNALLNIIEDLKIKIDLDSKVTKIIVEKNNIKGIFINKKGTEKFVKCDKVILATGGSSYKGTGSNGEGYILAKTLGHSITVINPSLVPIEVREKELCKKMQGLSLKNIAIKIINTENSKKIYEDFGEMLFTHFGVSGPIILTASAYILNEKNISKLLKNEKLKLYIDLKPALNEEKLGLRLIREFEEQKNKQFKNSLDNILPNKMIETIIKLSNINPDKKINEINKKERLKLVKLMKNLEFTLTELRPINEAIVTSGGINVKEINPKTMESKIIKGLFFAGEIIDVDACTGGFNLQIAYSTGYTAGKNSVMEIL